MTITNKVTLKSLNAGLTPATDVPDAPTIGTATAGIGNASVTFTAAATGGTPTSYTVTSNPGSITGTGASSPITVSGLTGGTSYTFTVTATNTAGTSPASSASNSVTPASPLGYESIQTVTVGSGGSSTITFSSIPQTFTHLQIRYLAQCVSSATAEENIAFRFNSDTGSNYTRHYINGNGSSASAGSNTGVTQVYATAGQTSATYPSAFGVGILDILDYTNTSKYTTTRALSGVDFNGSGGGINLVSGLWRNTAAITTIDIRALDGNLSQYSQFELYGIK